MPLDGVEEMFQKSVAKRLELVSFPFLALSVSQVQSVALQNQNIPCRHVCACVSYQFSFAWTELL